MPGAPLLPFNLVGFCKTVGFNYAFLSKSRFLESTLSEDRLAFQQREAVPGLGEDPHLQASLLCFNAVVPER